MATVYTHDVMTGTTTDFPTFALRCARAFGALIHMRDDPMDAPLREDTPSSYYQTELPKARRELANLEAMTEQQAALKSQQMYDAEVVEFEARKVRRAVEKARYEAMLTQARAWTPPTADHQGLKDFMIQQLTESMEFDCSGTYDRPPVQLSGADWLRARLEWQRDRVADCEAEAQKELERADGRSQWVQQLRDSLKQPEPV